MKNTQSLSAERVILSLFINQPELLDIYASLVKLNDFTDNFHKELYASILLRHKNGDFITFEFLEDDLSYRELFDEKKFDDIILTNEDSENFDRYLQELQEKTSLRSILSATREIALSVQDGQKSSDIIFKASKKCSEISEGNSLSKEIMDAEALAEELGEYYKVLEDKSVNGIAGISTGFRSLDKYLNGFNPGSLIIIGARPSMGKTALAINLALKIIEQGERVYFLSLEMTSAELSTRLISIMGMIPISKIHSGSLDENEKKRFMQKRKLFKTYKLHLTDSSGATLPKFIASIKDLKRKEPDLKVCFIDYLQLMSSTNSKDRQNEISELTRGLKLLARELNITIIALSQLNRSLESRNNKRPIMSDVRESDSIEQDADIILFIYRDDVYKLKALKEKEMEKAEIIIAKHRNGPTGTIHLHFHKPYTQFIDVSKWEQDENQIVAPARETVLYDSSWDIDELPFL